MPIKNAPGRWPYSMLATSTHDTKRSEDVRARLDVLSELPKTWSVQVLKWRKTNRTRKRLLADGRNVPDMNEEYLLYQTLLGSWPFALADASAGAEGSRKDFSNRIKQYMAKAVHEAKVNLSWINDDPAYVEALQQFVQKILAPGTRGRPNAFLEQIQAFLPSINLFGAINSLAQRLLMITAPGNPDIYRGTELWDFSLVDPDNRRPVDYGLRERLLSELDHRAEGNNLAQLCAELLKNYQDGRIKLWTTAQSLRLRREHRELFHAGQYMPLHAQGSKRDHMVAFARVWANQVAIIAVPRLSYTLAKGHLVPPLAELWENTELPVPGNTAEFMYNVFTGVKIRVTPSHTLLGRELFQHFPVALLIGA